MGIKYKKLKREKTKQKGHMS